MLSEFGEVLVMDWGIAKTLARPQPATAPPMPVLPSPSVVGATTGQEGQETLPGQAKGRPAFMAPEQARGEASQVGKASDVFRLGGILCVTLTGQPPYTQGQQALAGDVAEAFARLAVCGADAELIGLAKACLAPARKFALSSCELDSRDAGTVGNVGFSLPRVGPGTPLHILKLATVLCQTLQRLLCLPASRPTLR
jgi:serine/threonine protein kinase